MHPSLSLIIVRVFVLVPVLTILSVEASSSSSSSSLLSFRFGTSCSSTKPNTMAILPIRGDHESTRQRSLHQQPHQQSLYCNDNEYRSCFHDPATTNNDITTSNNILGGVVNSHHYPIHYAASSISRTRHPLSSSSALMSMIGGGGSSSRSSDHSSRSNNTSKKRTTHFSSFRLFMNQQIIVFQTCFVVALISYITRHNVKYQVLRHNMLAGTIIFMIGDWLAQCLTNYRIRRSQLFVIDEHRFVISAILGTIWAGIVNPGVYDMVERFLPGTNFRRVILKMLITCSILSTAGNYTTMFIRRFFKKILEQRISQKLPPSSQSTFNNMLEECLESCNRDFIIVVKDDLKIWPLYDLLCYSTIPSSIRPMTNALMASLWATYMSIASAANQTSPTNVMPEENEY